MKAPHFLVTAKCERDGYFIKERKHVLTISESGPTCRISKLVCPACAMWAPITHFEEVTV